MVPVAPKTFLVLIPRILPIWWATFCNIVGCIVVLCCLFKRIPVYPKQALGKAVCHSCISAKQPLMQCLWIPCSMNVSSFSSLRSTSRHRLAARCCFCLSLTCSTKKQKTKKHNKNRCRFGHWPPLPANVVPESSTGAWRWCLSSQNLLSINSSDLADSVGYLRNTVGFIVVLFSEVDWQQVGGV